MKSGITEEGYNAAAKELGVEPAVIKAVAEVESAGDGFLPDGRVKILFERHKFHKYTKGQYDKSHPDISSEEAGGYGKAGAHQNARFSEAFDLDPEAAMKSTSWGKFQIMGFNHQAAGFATVGEFVDAMKASEDEQLKAFVKLIKTWGLAGELRNKDWAGFAKQYNGAAYKKNKYDSKLAAAYERFRREPVGKPMPPVPDPSTDPGTGKPEPKPEPQVQTVPGRPPTIEVKQQSASWTTKIAAATASITPILTATGLKIGGVTFSTGTLYAIAAVVIVGIIVGGYIYNKGQDRAWERQKLSMENLASPDKNNVVSANS